MNSSDCAQAGMQTRSSKSGFTLVELVVSLAIVAVLTSIVLVRGNRQLQAAQASAFWLRVESMDRASRAIAAQAAAQVSLVVDLRNRSISRHIDTGTDDHRTLVFPKTFWDVACRTGDRWYRVGKINIPIAPSGQTPTYAFRFTMPDGHVRYYAVLGPTGQAVPLQTEEDVDALFGS